MDAIRPAQEHNVPMRSSLINDDTTLDLFQQLSLTTTGPALGAASVVVSRNKNSVAFSDTPTLLLPAILRRQAFSLSVYHAASGRPPGKLISSLESKQLLLTSL